MGLLPPEYAWFEPVLVASIVVFVVDLIGNSIAFGNRIVNALVTAIVFAIIFGALAYFGFGSFDVDVQNIPTVALPAEYAWFEPVLIASVVVFVIGLIGNAIAFGGKFSNALVTGLLFAVVFGALAYYSYGSVNVELRETPSINAPANTN
ncbi:MAG: hypothetical protein AAGF32_03180 [Pseudomonadota bacterium]